MSGIVQHINDVPLAGLMFIVALGYMVGRLSWRGLSPGPAAGTLLVALVLGHFGLSLEELYAAVLDEASFGWRPGAVVSIAVQLPWK